MAYTKKTETTVTEVTEQNDVIETEPIKEEVIEKNTSKKETTAKKETKKQPRKFEATTPVVCQSIVAGMLGMIGIKSHINYRWAGRGDETEVEYQDLVAAIRSSKNHIYKPYFIIKDNDFVEQFPQIKKIYSTMYAKGDLEDLLIKPNADVMIATIKTLPEGARETIKNIAATLIANGRIDSVKKIKALDAYYDTNFMLMSELFQ